ncbi:MAG: hypothetical protein P8127_12915 [Acidobacteriota bacterium]|jgi:hypothetical protein
MVRVCHAATLAAAIFGSILSAPLSAADGNGNPSFRVESRELDLGTIVAGTVAEAVFVFHNDGPEDVHIIRAKPS